ncbi:zinc finger protein 28 isoform X2 [Bicyclus anynana]|uniref:Zinc finger protein 28 isoform X2 n=1 Tax=Bicyclus anynana TaxID=110368 RepID=A0ABM3M3P8_BICAN|nr:zinc finger protein 28 isoform X2 [Bicyclus anynana]
MDTVKNELDNLCRGCLCVDRLLLPLNKNVDLFFIFLGNELSISEDSKYYNILLCWECIALLKKAEVFRKRVQTAHRYFERILGNPSTTRALSTLNIHNKDDYDLIYTENENPEPVIKPEALKFEVTFPENEGNCHIKEEAYYDDNDDNFDYEAEEPKPNVSAFVKKEKKKKTKYKKITPISKKIKTRPIKYTPEEIDRCIEEVVYTLKDILAMRHEKKPNRIKNMESRCNVYIMKLLDTQKKDLRQKVKNDGLTCSECETVVPDQLALAAHWESHPVALLRCRFCELLSKSRKSLCYHVESRHSIIYSCTLCPIDFRALPEYYRHDRELHRILICDYCGKKFNQKSGIERHIRRYHLPIQCEICKNVYKRESTLDNHMAVRHPEVKWKTVKRELTYCVECDIHFATEDLFKRHLRHYVRHRINPRKEQVPCPDCGKIFSRKSYMDNHYKLVHVRKSQHYCELCDKHFINGYAIRTHKKFVHEKYEKPKNKICDICGRGFHTNRVLINHKRTHTGERPHKCSYCSAAFAQNVARKTHEKTQHKHLLQELKGFST